MDLYNYIKVVHLVDLYNYIKRLLIMRCWCYRFYVTGHHQKESYNPYTWCL